MATHHTFFVFRHATRAVEIVATTVNPNGVFMAEVADILTDPENGFLRNARFLILDRDSKFTGRFTEILNDAGVAVVRCPARAPNCNAIAERFVKSVKDECLRRMICVLSVSLRDAVALVDLGWLQSTEVGLEQTRCGWKKLGARRISGM